MRPLILQTIDGEKLFSKGEAFDYVPSKLSVLEQIQPIITYVIPTVELHTNALLRATIKVNGSLNGDIFQCLFFNPTTILLRFVNKHFVCCSLCWTMWIWIG